MKVLSIVLGVILFLAILANLHTIIASVKWYSFNQNKIVSSETKVITYDDIFERLYHQRKMASELEHSIVYSRIGDEVRKGADEATDYEIFLSHNDHITFLKVRLPVTTYEDGEKSIEFVSGKGEVLQIFEDGEWQEFDDSRQE